MSYSYRFKLPEPEFRTMSDSAETRELSLEHHYRDFRRSVESLTLRMRLDLLVDGRPLHIEQRLPLRIESTATG